MRKFFFVCFLKSIVTSVIGENLMRVSNVSFGSFMVFQINDGDAHASIPALVRASFNNNPALQSYNLKDTFHHNELMDGTTHNAISDFCDYLDKKYRKILPKKSKNVFLTEAEFSKNPWESGKKYFITAADYKTEKQIFNTLNKSQYLHAVKYYR